jgi:hypothetical protein
MHVITVLVFDVEFVSPLHSHPVSSLVGEGEDDADACVLAGAVAAVAAGAAVVGAAAAPVATGAAAEVPGCLPAAGLVFFAARVACRLGVAEADRAAESGSASALVCRACVEWNGLAKTATAISAATATAAAAMAAGTVRTRRFTTRVGPLSAWSDSGLIGVW